VKRGPFELAGRNVDSQQDGIAGHQPGERAEVQVADRIGIAGDNRQRGCLQHDPPREVRVMTGSPATRVSIYLRTAEPAERVATMALKVLRQVSCQPQ
jgi:hypothetical protein